MLNNLIKYIKDEEYLIGIYESHVYIFNYNNIINVNEKLIKIKVKDKSIIINGSNLIIEKMDKREILINGNIKDTSLI